MVTQFVLRGAVLCVLALAAGCQNTVQMRMARNPEAAPTGDSAAYLDAVSRRPEVSNRQAVQGVLMLLGQKPDMEYDQAVAALKGRQVLPRDWKRLGHLPADKGDVAYMVYQSCPIKGGLTLGVFGPSRRYCLRELQYHGVMASGLLDNTVTGMEYVAILARADELRQTGKVSPVMVREAKTE